MKPKNPESAELRLGSVAGIRVRWILGAASAFLFLGAGWLFLAHRSPLSVLFWNQGWFENLFNSRLGVEWETYAANSENMIRNVETALGYLFFIGALLSIRVGLKGGRRRWRDLFLVICVLPLIPWWLLRWVDQDYQVPMFLEHFLQWGTPFLLVGFVRWKAQTWFRVAAVLTGATFVGHGLYALGWGGVRPHNFVNMVMELTHLDESGSVVFLNIVGILDLLFAVALFLPGRFRIAGLGYAAIWGMATAFARPLTHFTTAEDYFGMHPWLAEAIVRFPHGLIPLAMIFVVIRLDLHFHRKTAPLAEQGSLPVTEAAGS